MSILLIYPPVVKPCEPPPGIAMLAAALASQSVPVSLLDANIEGLLFLTEQTPGLSDAWTRRAFRTRKKNLEAITRRDTYKNFDRYKRTLADIYRLVHVQGRARDIYAGLSNYQDGHLSPLRSADCLTACEHPHRNFFFPYFARRIPSILEESQPEWVGFSLNFLSQALTTFAMIGVVKRVAPAIKIVLGGGLVTSWMRNPCWTNPFEGLVDRMIDGPGERALPALLEKGQPAEPVLPCYGYFPLASYFSPGFILPYSASRGCYWQRCSFCPERAEGNAYIPLPPRRVADELQLLVRQRKPVLIHLLDNALSPALLQHLALNPPGAPWYGFTRISELLADVDFCHRLKAAGCTMLKIGLESGSQGVLDGMEKGIDLGMASQVLHTLHSAGIGAYVYLLFGTPFESENDALMTLDFTVRHSEMIRFLNIAIFNLPAYGPEAGTLDVKDFYDGDLTLYRQFRHPHGWHRRRVRSFLEKEFKRHPAVAKIVRRDPPFFSSNHAPFFL